MINTSPMIIDVNISHCLFLTFIVRTAGNKLAFGKAEF